MVERCEVSLIFLLLLSSCSSEYDYRVLTSDRVDIHDVVTCEFEATDEGWEQYTCVPVFSAADREAQPWERDSIGAFDIVEQRIFGAPFYQLFYSGSAGVGSDIGYAISMDGVSWRRHPHNPLLRRGRADGAFDRDDASVACAAFDGDLGLYHLWYTGTNGARRGTLFGHATSPDGVFWAKDSFNPLDPFEEVSSELDRAWGCDALYEDGVLHFWVGGVTHASSGALDGPGWLESTAYDLAYLSTSGGSRFEGSGDLILEHRGLLGDAFDAEGVHMPSVFTFGDGEDGSPRYYMLYPGYRHVSATQQAGSDLIWIENEGQRLGMASSSQPDQGWTRVSENPVPLNFSDEDQSENPRAFFINGRVHVFFNDVFIDDFGDPVSGIGLGISPFPIGEEGT